MTAEAVVLLSIPAAFVLLLVACHGALLLVARIMGWDLR